VVNRVDKKSYFATHFNSKFGHLVYVILLVALFLLIFDGGGYIVSILLLQSNATSLFSNENVFLLAGQCVIYVFLAISFWLAGKWLFKKPAIKELFALKEPRRYRYFLLMPLLFVAYILTFGLITILISKLFPSFDATQSQDVGFQFVSVSDRIIAGLMLVFIVPFFEEAVFRGWLFGLLREKLNFWWVAIIVSATFGFLHGQWNVGIDVFLLSMVLCWFRERTGSIWVGVSMHALKNLLAFIVIIYTT
jgi:membrane protease YdiL (CAAX protease family)